MQPQARDDETTFRGSLVNEADEVGIELQELRASLARAQSTDESEALLVEFARRVDRLEREFQELRALLTRIDPAVKPS